MAYLLAVLIIVLVGFVFAILYITFVYSSLSGSPFVPSSQKELSQILKEAKLTRKTKFLDLGCGDGRVVIEAVKQYNMKGIGVDINPLLVAYARFQARRQHLNAQFLKQSIFDTPLGQADVIFLFLMPKLLAKLTPKLIREAKKGTQIISHGFALPGLADKLVKTRDSKPFPTYYYRL